MGLLDQLAGQVLGSLAGGNGQQGGGGQAALLQLVLSMLQGSQGGQGGMGGLGGLGGILARLGEAGLGDQAASWVSTGQNLPVSAEQIGQVFGGAELGDMAAQLGVSNEQVAGQLADILPQVIDRLTPNGQLPSGNGPDLGDALSGLAAMLGRG